MPIMGLLKPLMKLLMLSDKQSRIQNRHLKRLIAASDLKRASKNIIFWILIRIINSLKKIYILKITLEICNS